MPHYSQELLKRYRSSVTWLCCYLAQMQKFAELKVAGIDPPKKKLVYATSMAQRYMGYLLQDKEAMGLHDGLEFLGNNNFDGFSIIDGAFHGNKDRVMPVVGKWVKGFPDSADNYEYEVAIYALALAFSDEKTGLYPKCLCEGDTAMPAAA